MAVYGVLSIFGIMVLHLCSCIRCASGQPHLILNVSVSCNRQRAIHEAVRTMESDCPTGLEVSSLSYTSYKCCSCLLHHSRPATGRLHPLCLDREYKQLICEIHCPGRIRNCNFYLLIMYKCHPLQETTPASILLESFSPENTYESSTDKHNKLRQDVLIVIAVLSGLVAVTLIVTGACVIYHKKWKSLRRLRVKPERIDNIYTQSVNIRRSTQQSQSHDSRQSMTRSVHEGDLQSLRDSPIADRPRDNTEWMSIRDVRNVTQQTVPEQPPDDTEWMSMGEVQRVRLSMKSQHSLQPLDKESPGPAMALEAKEGLADYENVPNLNTSKDESESDHSESSDYDDVKEASEPGQLGMASYENMPIDSAPPSMIVPAKEAPDLYENVKPRTALSVRLDTDKADVIASEDIQPTLPPRN